MSYEADSFLSFANKATDVGGYYEHEVKNHLRVQALKDIVTYYRKNANLKNFLLCKKVAEIAQAAIVNKQVIIGRWLQLTGILDLYSSGQIQDIGLTAAISCHHKDKKEQVTTGQSFFIHDRGDSKLILQTGNLQLTETVEEVLSKIKKGLPRQQFFKEITKAFEKRSTKQISYTSEIWEYIHGETGTDLLHRSPSSFSISDWYYEDIETNVEEWSQIQALLKPLAINAIQRMIEYCGLKTEATQELINIYKTTEQPKTKQTALYDLKTMLWGADREDFYREYRRLAEKDVSKKT